MNILKSIADWGGKLQLYLGVAALFIIVASMTVGVITRFFGHPFDWTEELCTVLFVWLSFMGAGVAAQHRRHICVDYIVAKVSPAAARTVKIVTLVLVLVFLVILFVGAVKFLPTTVYAKTVALGIPRTVSYIPIAICSFFMIFTYLHDLITEIRTPAAKAL